MAKRSIYTKSLGGAVARGAKGSAHGKFHIISSGSDKWAIVLEGAIRPVRAFASQQAAVSFATQYAVSKSPGEVVIHGKDGSIINRIPV
jgi:hypothetical protein